MKCFSKLFCAALTTGLLLSPLSTCADLEVSGDVRIHSAAEFDAPLAPYGSWITVGRYGRCWRPANIGPDWRPYCNGDWEWTDCGWYWASEEPWSWACYHYGSWTLDPTYGWVWVPGIEWAPAWVSWRFGGGYCGWAPLGPRGVVLAPSLFVFVEDRHFREHHRRNTVIVNNTTIINRTKVINNIKHEERQIAGVGRQRVVVNEGPGAAVIERGTGKKIERTPIREAVRRTPAPHLATRGTTPTRSAEPARSQPAVPETRRPEARTVPEREARTPASQPREFFPETRTPPPETRTVPPPQTRTPPLETRIPPSERGPVRSREMTPPPPRAPVMSPRESERRGSAGRGWQRERERR